MTHNYHSKRHGEIELAIQNGVVICRPMGAFNLDGVINYEKIFAEKVRSFNSKKWALLNQYKEFEICGPEVIKRIRSQLFWSQAHGCQVIGFETFNAVQEYFVRQVTKDIPFRHVLVFSERQSTEFQIAEINNKLSGED